MRSIHDIFLLELLLPKSSKSSNKGIFPLLWSISVKSLEKKIFLTFPHILDCCMVVTVCFSLSDQMSIEHFIQVH